MSNPVSGSLGGRFAIRDTKQWRPLGVAHRQLLFQQWWVTGYVSLTNGDKLCAAAPLVAAPDAGDRDVTQSATNAVHFSLHVGACFNSAPNTARFSSRYSASFRNA